MNNEDCKELKDLFEQIFKEGYNVGLAEKIKRIEKEVENGQPRTE